jgi:hypothetical protein
MSYGVSVRELAVRLGEPTKRIDAQLEPLQAELVRLAD